ncbi:DUF4132 domain-containing protein [Nonomuraea jiangxiensis]|uniref:DUF4132 domain-containing protein n=1 Tax=Nonomuraea jiangxiensis TaxID=633440 RepID=UPI001C40B6AC|nr:DUF4132 domain-containing protein [Nonomuraea jiangxiensis]
MPTLRRHDDKDHRRRDGLGAAGDENRIRRLAEAGDATGLATELLRTVGVPGFGGPDWTWLTDVLDVCPDEFRLRAALAITELSDHVQDRFVEVVLRKVSFEEHLELVESVVVGMGGKGTQHVHDLLTDLTQAWPRAGREVPGPVVGAVRRAVQATYGIHKLERMAGFPGHPPFSPGEAWADQALADLDGLGEPWRALAAHAVTATTAQPTAAWEQRARRLLDAVGPEAARTTISRWLALVGRPRTMSVRHLDDEAFDPYNALGVRGLIWMLAFLPPGADSPRVLGHLVETALKKVQGLGPRSPMLANAAVHALARMEGEAAPAQLARLSARVTYKGTAKVLGSVLDARAAALGLTREEVEELAVPTYGLTEVGRRTATFGEVTAELTVTGTRTGITWRTAAGRTVKSPPASVRQDHPEGPAELKSAAKDIDKMLAAQVERLDQQFLTRREWPYRTWRERYLDHPLLGTLGRRLIWLVGDRACCYADGRLRGLDGVPLDPAEEAAVRLWHPIGRDVEEVVAWRDRLEHLQITQPFKQAHREVYVLTAAEKDTRVYSNRYAAHILRQHQFHALAAQRGWHNRLRLMVDDTYPPATRELPRWGLRAEFWVEGIGDDHGGDTLDSGAYLRLATDQVRFYPAEAPANSGHAYGGGYEQWVPGGAAPVLPLPLEQIPPLVFSEIMRDVDLFVGVASVGNDPTWNDGGPEGRFRDYWTSYSFGELSGTARTRRDLLDRLIPRLAIAGRCTLDGRFLHVRGELRTYKIHLGSGNILMTPNDQYLCIVPQRSAAAATGEVHLPFEGDGMLAVILSKALMLARDTEITDPTITRQIR